MSSKLLGFFFGKKYYCQEALTVTIYEYKYGTCYLNLHVTLSRVYLYLTFGLFCASCLNHSLFM